MKHSDVSESVEGVYRPALTWAAYTRAVERTARSAPLHKTRRRDQLTNFALGLAGEAGEVVEAVKKHVYHQHPLDRDHLVEELGDVLWYVTALASALGVPLDDIAAANVAKLLARYPEGFDPVRSRERD